MKLLVILIIFFLVPFSFSQHEDQIAETESTVPELTAYHKTIYPLWHNAYPNKDYEQFKKLLPDVKSGADKIFAAALPGILRDKSDAWKEGLNKLRNSVDNFETSVNENNETQILSSAEKLHSDYEMLVRIIRPVTREVDEFHKVLYMVYHHYAPDNKTDELNNAIDTLVIRAAKLKDTVLPKRAENKKEKYLQLSSELETSVLELQKIKDKGPAEVTRGIDIVHTNYQKLEHLFD